METQNYPIHQLPYGLVHALALVPKEAVVKGLKRLHADAPLPAVLEWVFKGGGNSEHTTWSWMENYAWRRFHS